MIAIRAGQASGVELLTQHGAPLEGGRSNGKLIAADGRAPVGAREKMMARRWVGRVGERNDRFLFFFCFFFSGRTIS